MFDKKFTDANIPCEQCGRRFLANRDPQCPRCDHRCRQTYLIAYSLKLHHAHQVQRPWEVKRFLLTTIPGRNRRFQCGLCGQVRRLSMFRRALQRGWTTTCVEGEEFACCGIVCLRKCRLSEITQKRSGRRRPRIGMAVHFSELMELCSQMEESIDDNRVV